MTINKNSILALAIGVSISANAQKATFVLSEYIPESGSVTEINAFNPNFDNAFVFVMAHGLTVFNQSRELFLIDSKTFAEKKKIDYPKYKGYDNITTYVYADVNYKDIGIEMNKNLILTYSSKIGKQTGISAVKIGESFTAPEKPELLFTTTNDYSIRSYRNDKKDLCLFTYFIDDKKTKRSSYNFRLYDANLKLLKADSVQYEYDGVPNAWAHVYDNGYVLSKRDGNKLAVTLNDVKSGKSSNFVLTNGTNSLNIVQVKGVGDKVIIFGEYSNLNGKKMSNGFFKATVKGGTLEEQIYFDHVPAGEFERDKEGKNVDRVVITDAGACYALISQGPTPPGDYDFADKYEVVYINTASDKWKKQLPITPKTLFEMNFTKGALRIATLDYEGDNNKIDPNNYVNGKPKPSTPVTLRQIYKSNISVLSVAPTGTVTRETFVDNYYKTILNSGSGFLGIHQGLNGQVTSKCKFFKISFD